MTLPLPELLFFIVAPNCGFEKGTVYLSHGFLSWETPGTANMKRTEVPDGNLLLSFLHNPDNGERSSASLTGMGKDHSVRSISPSSMPDPFPVLQSIVYQSRVAV